MSAYCDVRNVYDEIDAKWREWYERMNAMDNGSYEAACELPDVDWRIRTIKEYLSRKAWRERWQKSAHEATWEANRAKVFWGDYDITRMYSWRCETDYWE